jgi:hypothetical protein
MSPTELLTQWQSQPVDLPRVSVEDFRSHVSALEQRAKRKTVIVYASVAWWGLLLLMSTLNLHSWVSRGLFFSGLYFLIYALYQIRAARRSGHPINGTRVAPEFKTGLDARNFCLSELEWLRDDAKKLWHRTLAIVPGACIILIAEIFGNPALAKQALVPQIAIMTTFILYGAIKNTARIAAFEREIHLLKLLE